MRDDDLLKYPRTRHIEGSGLQTGDHDLSVVPFADLAGRTLLIEEKVDGANVGISFSPTGELRLDVPGAQPANVIVEWQFKH